jgi:hypothetical protein
MSPYLYLIERVAKGRGEDPWLATGVLVCETFRPSRLEEGQ